jgi:HEAT repeat protein
LDILELLWLISSTLTAASIVILCGLIVSRAVTDRLARIDEAKGLALAPLLLAEPQPGAESAPMADRRLVRVAAELVGEAAGPTERGRILSNAERLGVAQRLRADLRSRLPGRRSTAAALLADFPDARTVAALSAALEDADGAVRLAAALSLARMGRAPPARTLVDTLGLGAIEHSRLTGALFDEIAAVHPEQLVDLVTRNGLSPVVERAAIEALSDASGSGVGDLLIELASDRHVGARDLAFYLEKLGDLGDASAATVVESGLGDRRPRVRSAAAQAAGKLGLEAAVPGLTHLLADRNWWVRFRAGEALVGMGDLGRGQLREVAASGRTVARKTAAITLAEHGLAA